MTRNEFAMTIEDNDRAKELMEAFQFLKGKEITYSDPFRLWQQVDSVSIEMYYRPPHIKNPIERIWKWFHNYETYFLVRKIIVFKVVDGEVLVMREGQWQEALLQKVAAEKAKIDVEPFMPIDDAHMFEKKNAAIE